MTTPAGRAIRWPARQVTVGVAVLWLALPLLPLLLWAGADNWSFPAVLPDEWGVRGWREAAAAGLPGAMLRSLGLGIAVAAIATPVGLVIGRELGWRRTRHPRLVVGLLLVPLVLPPFAIAMGLDILLIRVGMPEVVSVVLLLAVVATPYTAYTAATGFARVSPELEHQARALGASLRQARTRVVLPAIRGSALVAALLAFLVGWSDYVVTLLVGGGQFVTAPVLLGATASGSGNDAAVAATALATLLPPVLLVTAAAGFRGRREHPNRCEPDLPPTEERTPR